MRVFRGVANLVALLVTGGLGVTFILGGAGMLSFSSITPYLDRVPGTIFLILVGVALLFAGISFLMASAEELFRAGVFARESEGGRIALTSFAVKEYVSGVLRDEIGLDHFRVQLKRCGDGVAITVRITLSPDQRVTEVGGRIQSVLAREVPGRTGVGVSDVSILVRGIRSLGKPRPEREEIIRAPDVER